jgi:Spy/CpxP family protein refolding chaperone
MVSLMRSIPSLLAGVAVLGLAGCGTLPTPLNLLGEEGAGLRAFGGKGARPVGHMGGGKMGSRPGPGAALGLLAVPGIELTQEQKAAVKAIMEKYRPAKPEAPVDRAAHKAQRESLVALLKAESFDAVAFKSALAGLKPPAAPPRPDAAMFTELRAVLTDEQRTTAIARLKEMPEPPAKMKEPGAHLDKMAEKLKLTDEQKAKLAALHETMQAQRPIRKPGTRKAALIAFLETGGVADLMPSAEPPALPVDAVVDFVGSLDATQRTTLAQGHGLPGLDGGRGHRNKGHSMHGRGGHGKQGPRRPMGFGFGR